MPKPKKISDSQFLSMLRENAGLFARTAKAIRDQFGIAFSRQAVAERARRHPKEMKDIEEENLDIAEDGLHSFMRSTKTKDAIRIKAIELYLKTKGRKRGYSERFEVDHTTKGDAIQPPTPLKQFTYEQLQALLGSGKPKKGDKA